MKMIRYKDSIIESALFFLVFTCFLVVAAFVFPQVDEHIFCVSTEPNIHSILNYCVSYGNGRLIGNFLCVAFSHLYIMKPVFISIIMTLLIFSLYKLFFSGKTEMILPMTVLCLCAPAEMLEATMYNFPSFTNYVVPCAIFILIFAVMTREIRIRNQILRIGIIAILNVSACLFSENSTGIIVAFAVLFVVLKIRNKKKIILDDVVFFASIIVGSFLMYIIPKLANVDTKLDSYHSLTFSVTEILSNFMLSMDIVSDFVLLSITLSFCLLGLTLKKRKLTFADSICIVVVLLYILVSIMLLNKENDALTRALISFLSILFFCAVAFLVVKLPMRKSRYICLGLLILIMASVIPMSFINILSHRTFYITFIMVLLLCLYLLKETINELKFIGNFFLKFKNVVVMTFAIFVMVVSVTQFQHQAEKFGNYVFQNEMIKGNYSQSYAEKFESGINTEIYAFALENSKYFNPRESVIWPRESWIGIFQ